MINKMRHIVSALGKSRSVKGIRTNRERRTSYRGAMFLALVGLLAVGSSQMRADIGNCGGADTTLPFTDVTGNPFFCQIAAAFFSGLTNGTSPTTYSPQEPVPREQMAAFVSRTLDQSLRRGSQRAALGQFWTPETLYDGALNSAFVRSDRIQSDGRDLWSAGLDQLARVRASDGEVLETWTLPIASSASAGGVLVARGRIYVTTLDGASPGRLYTADPTQAPGSAALVSSSLGIAPRGIAYDGRRIWTANSGFNPGTGSISIINFGGFGASVTTISQGFDTPIGILFDGANMWVTDYGLSSGGATLKKLDALGNILQTIPMDAGPNFPAFDGTNIWVPCLYSNTVKVVRRSTGEILATLTGNGLNRPAAAAFDGERILVTNGGELSSGTDEGVSLWKAADLTSIDFYPVQTSSSSQVDPSGVCSDGLRFYVALRIINRIARF